MPRISPCACSIVSVFWKPSDWNQFVVRLNFAVDEEAWNAGLGGTPNSRDGGVCAGVIEDDGGGIGGDGGIDEVVLAIGVIVMSVDAYSVAESKGSRGSGIRFGLEEGIVLGRNKNDDQPTREFASIAGSGNEQR
jgi:hypothetical protein